MRDRGPTSELTRPGRVALLGAVAALVLAAAGCGEDRPEPRSELNVVVIMTDDQTVADLGVMSATKRSIAGAGAQLRDSVVSFPLCCPSRATYLTGLYAHNHGVLSNSPDFDGGYGRLDGEQTLAVWLQEAGYETAQVGRYLNFYGVLDPTEVPPGWDQWAVPPGPSTYVMYDYDLNINGELVGYGGSPADYQTDVYAELATEFIEDQAGNERPFFLSITPLAPHDENDERVPSPFDGPRAAPRHRGALSGAEHSAGPAFNEADVSDKPSAIASLPRLTAKQRRQALGSYQRRARSLLAVDDLVGDVISSLRRSDQLAETYVIFTSDNGYLLGEHRLTGKIAPYEESIRVPLLIRGPGIDPGTEVSGMAANIDLAPTILEIAAADSRRLDGISLLPTLLGEDGLPRRQILLENLDRSRVPKQRLYEGLRGTRWSYFEFDDGEAELYDLRSDPGQLENLAGERQARGVENRHAERLERLRGCRGLDCGRL